MKPLAAIHQMELNSEFSHISSEPPSLTVPFPCSSPPSPPLSPPIYPPRLSPPRACSSPIILSNGKRLKSSLKSSSAPESHRHTHLRARSATLPIPKNVHFAEEHRLESVRIFSRSEKPASLSATHQDETDTENGSNIYFPHSPAFPFIPLTSLSTHTTPFHLDHSTSTIPSTVPSPHMNIHLESLALSSSSESTPVLVGFLIVRNIAYEKQVAVRFTMDDWQTTSEVLARHVESLPSLPLPMIPSVGHAGKCQGELWDRFTFTIRLGDCAFGLQEKVVWLVAKYTTAGGEWWDNNEGSDYRVGFRAGIQSAVRRTTSAPAHVSVPTHVLVAPPNGPNPASAISSQGYPSLPPLPVRPSQTLHPRPTLPPPPASIQTRTPTQKLIAHGSPTEYFLVKASPPKVALSLNSSDSLDNWSRLSRGSRQTRGNQDSGDLNSVYKAFVRDWCFAEGPPPAASVDLL